MQGICALTICSEPCLLALPSSGGEGTLRIYNLLAAGGNVLCELAAHKSPVVGLLSGCLISSVANTAAGMTQKEGVQGAVCAPYVWQ